MTMKKKTPKKKGKSIISAESADLVAPHSSKISKKKTRKFSETKVQNMAMELRPLTRPPSREVLGKTLKAASHPIRNLILKQLKLAPSDVKALEEVTGRSRYDLYHHLAVLDEENLIEQRFRDGKTKEFSLAKPSNPHSIAMLFDHEDLEDNPKALDKLIEAAEELEGSEIPHKERISGVQMILSLATEDFE